MEASRKVDIAERLAGLLARLSPRDQDVVLAFGEGMACMKERLLPAAPNGGDDGRKAS